MTCFYGFKYCLLLWRKLCVDPALSLTRPKKERMHTSPFHTSRRLQLSAKPDASHLDLFAETHVLHYQQFFHLVNCSALCEATVCTRDLVASSPALGPSFAMRESSSFRQAFPFSWIFHSSAVWMSTLPNRLNRPPLSTVHF